MQDNLLYKILQPLNKIVFTNFRVEYVNKEYLPKKESFILAGNHTSYFDPIVLMSSTKRQIHFLGKIELFKGLKKYLFKSLGLIPVDRSKKNPEALKLSEELLNKGLVIGIFPEGTINHTKNIILPFKYGAVSVAQKTNSYIVPFVIAGKYNFFHKNIKVIFSKPYKITKNLQEENTILENKIITLIRSTK